MKLNSTFAKVSAVIAYASVISGAAYADLMFFIDADGSWREMGILFFTIVATTYIASTLMIVGFAGDLFSFGKKYGLSCVIAGLVSFYLLLAPALYVIFNAGSVAASAAKTAWTNVLGWIGDYVPALHDVGTGVAAFALLLFISTVVSVSLGYRCLQKNSVGA